MNARGMLWYDPSPDELAGKVAKAADYYRRKYGRRADLCLVNPAALPDGEARYWLQDGEIHVKAVREIMPGHLLIGVESEG